MAGTHDASDLGADGSPALLSRSEP